MNSVAEEKSILSSVLDLLEAHMGPETELVLHDHNDSNNIEHTIVDIRNPEITGRKIGGSVTDDGLKLLRGALQEDYNHEAELYKSPSTGHTLVCTTCYIYGKNDKLIGSICINHDIQRFLAAQLFLHDYNLNNNCSNSTYISDIGSSMMNFIDEGIYFIGKKPEEMNRDEKKRFVRFLDSKGVFMITKSSNYICSMLGISKYTLYNYLGKITKNEKDQ